MNSVPHYGTVSDYIAMFKKRFRDYHSIQLLESNDNRLSRTLRLHRYDQRVGCEGLNSIGSTLYTRIYSLTENTRLQMGRRVALSRDGKRLHSNMIPLPDGEYQIMPSANITNLYNNLFYDPGVLEFIRCTLHTMFTSSSLSLLARFWIHNIRRIGESSSNGEVKSARVGGYDELVIFKTASSSNTVIFIKYEGMVGIEINKLRRMGNINFAYTYGIIRCRHDSICKPDDIVMMQEFIKGTTVSRYIRTIDNRFEFMSIVLQLIFSLNWAYDEVRFHHCDLHSDNVMIRQPPRGWDSFLIPYLYRGRYIYIRSRMIATLIDYGRATMRVDNEVVHSVDYYGSDPSTIGQLVDIFRILCSLYINAYKPKNKVTSGEYVTDDMGNIIEDLPAVHPVLIGMLEDLIGFFLDVSELRRINQSSKRREWSRTYFILPSTSPDITFDMFIDYIATHPRLSVFYNGVVGNQIDRPILNCGDNCNKPTNFIPQRYDPRVKSVLDFIIRVNEKVEVVVEDWDKLIEEWQYLLSRDHDHKVVGLGTLSRNIIDTIPRRYRDEILPYL